MWRRSRQISAHSRRRAADNMGPSLSFSFSSSLSFSLSLSLSLASTLILSLVLILFLTLTSCASRVAGPQLPVVDDQYRVFYEIYVASFYDADGDGKGDLRGILEKLDYLRDPDSARSLQVGGLWLMPVMPSPSYHKYDVTDYYQIDPAYGTLEDFKTLATACEERGVALIIDLPINHTSNLHPWFLAACEGDARYVDYYNFRDSFASGYHQVPNSTQFYEGHFGSHMPDLNLANEAVRQEILNICRFWLQNGVRGFRLDAVAWFFNANTTANAQFLSWLQQELQKFSPDVYLVGEAWSDATTIVDLYQSGIPSFFNFPFSQSTGTLISSVRAGRGDQLARALDRWYAQLPTGAIDAPFLTNHDQARSASALMSNPVLQKQAAAVYLLLPGNPFIYYGEEIGMKGGSGKDENKRTPLYWSLTDDTGMCDPPPGADDIRPVEAGIAEQLKDRNSLLNFYIATIAVKNRHPELARGEFSLVESGFTSVCAYTVTYRGRTLMVAHNLGEESVAMDIADAELVDTLAAGRTAPHYQKGRLSLAAYSTAVLFLPDKTY
jgi:alpha-amylase